MLKYVECSLALDIVTRFSDMVLFSQLVSGLDFYRKVGIDSKKHGVIEALHKDKNTLLQTVADVNAELDDLRVENEQLKAEIAALVSLSSQKVDDAAKPKKPKASSKTANLPPPSASKPKKTSSTTSSSANGGEADSANHVHTNGKKKATATSRLPPPSPQVAPPAKTARVQPGDSSDEDEDNPNSTSDEKPKQGGGWFGWF
jgi:hypothetical protein